MRGRKIRGRKMSAGNLRDFYGNSVSVRVSRSVRAVGGYVLLCGCACTEFKPRSDIETNTGALTGGQSQMQTSVSNVLATDSSWACLGTPPPAPVVRPTVSYTVTIVDSV